MKYDDNSLMYGGPENQLFVLEIAIIEPILGIFSAIRAKIR